MSARPFLPIAVVASRARRSHCTGAAAPAILRLHARPLADLLPAKTAPQPEGPILPDRLSELCHELVLVNRILANEGVLDAFGHVSVRHPEDPGRYLLARSRAPALVVPEDILEYTLDSEPVQPPVARPVTERAIHGCIYAARGDVMAVCHHHAPAVPPFCIAGKPIVPVFHLGATIGEATPLWDQHDAFGDTNLLVANNDTGRSLAQALGRHPVVLMRGHGATVVGGSLRELVARAIFLCQNADYQMRAHLLGAPQTLHPGETRLAGQSNIAPGVLTKIWDFYHMRLIEAGRLGPRAAATTASRAKTKPDETKTARIGSKNNKKKRR
jgi:HCOMODA/2-hydroxy-3-carboxy-muconic semialdehyde decarboxylase